MRHVVGWIAGAAGLYALACGACPGFARAALVTFAMPAMDRLHALTAAAPFPVVEPLAVGMAALTLAALAKAVVARSVGALRCPARALLCLAVALALLWVPALALPVEAPPVPGAKALEGLCERLIDALNGADLDCIDPIDCLRRAGDVAGMPGRVVKAARYPEWMRARQCAGLFVPLTGEALVDADAPAALVPFTAVHELAHLRGVADEGAANIATWRRCVDAGGDYAASARLWALRYAMGMLKKADPTARRRAGDRMPAALARAYLAAGGDAISQRGFLSRGDYAALVGYLVQTGEY